MSTGLNWNRWDLHVHTPYTKLSDNYKGKDKESLFRKFCESLNNYGCKCIGITDYFSVKNYIYLIENRDKYGLNKEIVLFPNIELRLSGIITKSKSSPHNHVNVHVILDPNIQSKDLEKFLRNLRVVKENGINLNYLDDYDELITDKVNYVPSVESFKQALITTFSVDYKNKCLIMVPNGGDGLSSKKGNGNGNNVEFMKEFVDLIQTSGNPKDREFYLSEECYKSLGKLYPCITGSDAHSFDKFQEYELNKSTWIKSRPSFNGLKALLHESDSRIKIQEGNPNIKLKSKQIDSIILPEDLFGSKEIKFNSDLNTIIGGRSSGKSLILSLLSNKLANHTQFKKNNKEYNEFINKLSEGATVKLKDGSIASGEMNIEYFYQDGLQEIASDVNKRDNFIENIFKNTVDINDMISEKNQLSNSIDEIIIKLAKINGEIEKISEKILSNQTHNQIKTNIKELEEEISKFASLSTEDKEIYSKFKNEIENIQNSKKTLIKMTNKLQKIQDTDFFIINEELDDFEEYFTIDPQDLEVISKINKNINKKITSKISELDNNIENCKKELEEIEKDESFIELNKLIDNQPRLSDLNEKLSNEKERLKNIQHLNDLLLENNNYKREWIDYLETTIASFKIDKSTNIYNSDRILIESKYFVDLKKIKNILNSNLKTGFNKFKELSPESLRNLTSWDEYSIFTEEAKIFNDLMKLSLLILKDNPDIFKANSERDTFLRQIFGFSYIGLTYDIKYMGSDFYKMSEGKKAFVLLLMKLSLTEEDCPLLIDQPEDDLDNKSIIKDLVNYLREEKLKRQIIVVTHNANIVVAADSDQVIVAEEIENSNGVKFKYVTGCLEDEEINNDICKILEGGKEAFNLRGKKYIF
ncbi:TrlF family AAA-like ATPase [Macrococcoides caseolyticum]|nr:hypothetical protein [Macrococcus caseolyticus]RKO15995.1 hypothetical protein D6861_03880 [Macrococcus caseolyticus]